jgi:hypothetical protein
MRVSTGAGAPLSPPPETCCPPAPPPARDPLLPLKLSTCLGCDFATLEANQRYCTASPHRRKISEQATLGCPKQYHAILLSRDKLPGALLLPGEKAIDANFRAAWSAIHRRPR